MSHQRRFITAAALGLVAMGTMTPAAKADFLYVGRDDSTITRIDTMTKVETVFATAGLSRPTGLAFDVAGNLYAANYYSGTIERFTPGGVSSLFATGLNGPEGLAVDAAGNLYMTSGNTIERFTSGGVGSTFASNDLSNPVGLAFDTSGNLYAANSFDNTIAVFTPGGVGSIFETGTASRPLFLAFQPSAFAVPKPSSLALLGIGRLILLARLRRNR